MLARGFARACSFAPAIAIAAPRCAETRLLHVVQLGERESVHRASIARDRACVRRGHLRLRVGVHEAGVGGFVVWGWLGARKDEAVRAGLGSTSSVEVVDGEDGSEVLSLGFVSLLILLMVLGRRPEKI